MTNKEWLDYLAHNAPDELAAWFDSEHAETANATVDGDTAALDAKIAELTAKRDEIWHKFVMEHELNNLLRAKLGECADMSEQIRNIAMDFDEGLA